MAKWLRFYVELRVETARDFNIRKTKRRLHDRALFLIKLDKKFRGWKLNNWTSIIHYSLCVLFELFIVLFKFL